MDCKKCGKSLEEAWIACPFCGAKVKQARAKKRGNREGSIYKRGKTWTARITTETYTVDGKLKQKRPSKGGFATRAEALLFLSTLTKEPVKKAPSLEYYHSVFEAGKLQKLSKDKKGAYCTAWNKIPDDLKGRPIDCITVGEMQQVINEKCPTFYPARDVRALLNHLFRLAAADGNANPGLPDLLALPTLEETEQEVFTEAEQRLLWESYEKGNTNAGLPLLLIYTGMMTGEIRKLRTDMIHWEEKEIVGSGLKTKVRRKKSILLPDTILPVLESLTLGKEGLLFPVCENKFYKLYYAALQTAGITRQLTPYACRHTTATALAIDENIAPQTIRRVMRWSSTRMLDRYAHPKDNDARQALQSLKSQNSHKSPETQENQQSERPC